MRPKNNKRREDKGKKHCTQTSNKKTHMKIRTARKNQQKSKKKRKDDRLIGMSKESTRNTTTIEKNAMNKHQPEKIRTKQAKGKRIGLGGGQKGKTRTRGDTGGGTGEGKEKTQR